MCDPEPDDASMMKPTCPTDPMGPHLLDDVDLTGYELTPADFNDGAGVMQFCYVPGDLDFDGVVTYRDQTIIQNLNCATLDDTELMDIDGRMVQGYVHQGAQFQQLLMSLEMDTADGMGGNNSDAVTPDDIAALKALVTVPYPCLGDVTGDDATTLADFSALATNFGLDTCAKRTDGDINGDGAVDLADFGDLGTTFGCTTP